MSQALRASHADDNADELRPDGDDPYGEIIAEEARQHQDALRQMGSALEDEDAGSFSSEETSPEGETTSGETGNVTSSETGRNSDEARRPGIDEALRDVESQMGKQTADVFRSVMADRSRLSSEVTNLRDEWNGAQQEMRESLAEVRGMAQGRASQEDPAAEPEDGANPWSLLTEEQQSLYRGLFESMAQEKGYVRADDLSAQEQEQAASAYVNGAVDQGLNQWGNDFGYRGEDGNFYYNDDVAGDVDDVYSRIYDPLRGLSAKDLYVLAKHDQIVDSARGNAEEAESKTQALNQRVQNVRRAAVESRSSAGRSDPSIYKRGEDMAQTIARAAAAAYRDLPEPGAKK